MGPDLSVNLLHGPARTCTGCETEPVSSRRPVDGPSFADVLEQTREGAQTPGLRFSGHAQQRLEARNIALTDAELDRLEAALEEARAKGAGETLLLMDRLALVASAPNRTVITVLEADRSDNAVFTNIDTAVVVAGGDAQQHARHQPQRIYGPDPFAGGPYAPGRPPAGA